MKLFVVVSSFFLLTNIFAQTDTIYLAYLGGYTFEDPIIPYSAYTAHFDALNKPYLYSACQELGLLSFSYDIDGNVIPTDTLTPFAFGGLKPTNVFQKEELLYVSLGGFAGLFPQKAGLAIVDISNPENMSIISHWDSAAFNQGSAIVIVHNTTAFLGAMEKGVIALDVNNPSAPVYLSNIIPDPNYPDIPGLFSTPNARGMTMYGDDFLILCYDHGGLRKIDVSNPAAMIETDMYMNWDIYTSAAPAYNNVAIKNDIAYVTVDYCGMDVINLATDSMINIFWYNPWECAPDNWQDNPGHSNSIVISADSNLLFMSGGDSEVLMFDITNPEEPKKVGAYAFPFDSVVAWSADVHENLVSLALVNNSIFGVPYYSNVGGVYLLQWNGAFQNMDPLNTGSISVFPNPADAFLYVQTENANTNLTYRIFDLTGRIMQTGIIDIQLTVSIRNLTPGIYLLEIFSDTDKMNPVLFMKK